MILLFFASPPAAPTYPTAYAYAYWRNNMNLTRKISTTTYPIVFMMVDATDHITGETGLTPTVTISKNGASFGAVSGSVTELGGGLYSLAGNATDRNTLGELWIHAEAAGADNVDLKVDIVSHDPYGDIAEILTDTGTTIPGLLDAIKGAGWTDETLVALMTAVESGTVDEATIRSAIGMATANLDTQLADIDSQVGTIYSEMASVDDVWDEALAGHTTAGTAGKMLADIPTTLSTTGVVLTGAGVDAILDEVVVGSYTLRQLVKVMAAAMAGKLSGGGTTTMTFRGIDDTSNVIVATVDSDGNRSALTVTV